MTTLFEHRADPEVNLEPRNHLLRVGFQAQPGASHAHAGAPIWYGTRRAGRAHLVEPDHRVAGVVPHATDHVVPSLGRGRLADLARKSLDAACFEPNGDGVPHPNETLRRL